MKHDRMNIRNDPFVIEMMSRIPSSERSSFSDEQLANIKMAFGARTWGIHPVDLRWTLKIWHKRYYFVFVAGVNRRPLSRRQQELARVGTALLMTGVFGFAMLLGLLFLYLLKSAAGIDIDPDSSLGIWDWFREW